MIGKLENGASRSMFTPGQICHECGYSNWLVGRQTVECGNCQMPLLLADNHSHGGGFAFRGVAPPKHTQLCGSTRSTPHGRNDADTQAFE